MKRIVWAAGLGAAAVLAAGAVFGLRGSPAFGEDPRVARVESRAFVQSIRRSGMLTPFSQQDINAQVQGTLLEIVADGAAVAEGAQLFLVDPKPHEEALTEHESKMRRVQAEWTKERETLAKELQKARSEQEDRRLKLDLETLRLKEMELGPSTSDELNAKNQLENARNLFEALSEELTILESLAEDGFVSEAELRQKQLDTTEQELKVKDAEIKYRKLHLPDPIKVGEQKLKVQEASKARERAAERVEVLERNKVQAEERFKTRWTAEEKRLADLKANIGKTKHVAPTPGVAMVQSRWGMRYGPGAEVHPGRDVIRLSDLRRMKAVLTVDEGRIGRVTKGQAARLYLPGLPDRAFAGKIVRVAEKGRDEFESLRGETREYTGMAERQVFDVEVELTEESDALRPGLRVEVELELGRLDQALVVPRAALVREKDAVYVRLVTSAGSERRNVTVVGEDRLYVAVEGVEEGARVWLVTP